MAISKYHYDREGLVIILDALGIKEIEKRDEAFDMLENWDTVYDVFRKEIQSQNQKLRRHNLTAGVDFKGFSDTIIISVPVTINPKLYRDLTNRDDYWWMINILGEALIPLFLTAISKNIFLRGALSVGKFYQSDNMIIGPAVKDAANYYNRPKWVGICTAPTASKVLDREWGTMGMALDIFRKYDIPVGESNSERGWALLWPKKDSQGKAQQIIREKSECNYKKGKREVYLKYKRTLDFCG